MAFRRISDLSSSLSPSGNGIIPISDDGKTYGVTLDTIKGQIEGKLTSSFTDSSSHETLSSSVDENITSINSLNQFTSSADNRLGSLETFTGSLNDTFATDLEVTQLRNYFNSYTSSNNNTNSEQNDRLSSIETFTGSLSDTVNDILTIEGRLDELEIESGSIRSDFNQFTSSFLIISQSFDDRISSLENPLPTSTPIPTSTETPTPTATVEPTPTPTDVPEPTATVEPTPTSTVEPTPTATVEPTPTPTVEYELFTAYLNRDEGQSAFFELRWTNVTSGTTVGFTLSGTATPSFEMGGVLEERDYTEPTDMFFTVDNSGFVILEIPINEDSQTEGTETIILTLDAQDSNGNPTGDLQKTVTINDTSELQNWEIVASTHDEGITFNHILNTEHVPAGTEYYWYVNVAIGYPWTPASAADFVGGVVPSGSGTISTYNETLSQSAVIPISIVADSLTEGDEVYQIIVREGSPSNPGTFRVIQMMTITDTSLTPVTTPTPTPTDVPEPTATVEPTPTATVEPTPTSTDGPIPTPTDVPEPTATDGPNPTPTATVEPTPTSTDGPIPTPTDTPVPTSTETPTPTPTSTVEPTPTPTSIVDPTPTATVEPTGTPVPNPTPTPTVNLQDISLVFQINNDGGVNPWLSGSSTYNDVQNHLCTYGANNWNQNIRQTTGDPNSPQTGDRFYAGGFPIESAQNILYKYNNGTSVSDWRWIEIDGSGYITVSGFTCSTPTPTPTVEPTGTPVPTPTSTEVPPTDTPVPTSTETPTPTATVEPTPTPTEEPDPTPTSTPNPTPTSAPSPTYSLSSNNYGAEGTNLTFTLTTTELQDGDIVPFTLSGTATIGDDYSEVNPKEFEITNNSSTYTVTTFQDNFTDGGDETIILTLDAVDSQGNNTGGISTTASIGDASFTPTQTPQPTSTQGPTPTSTVEPTPTPVPSTPTPTPTVSLTCLDGDNDNTVNYSEVQFGAGNYYIFNGNYDTYHTNTGSYLLKNVSSSHPITVLNNGKESLIYVDGTHAGTKIGSDGNSYSYYYGDVIITVQGNYGTVSYECYYHGYMGGQDNLVFSNTCPLFPTPTPTSTVEPTATSVPPTSTPVPTPTPTSTVEPTPTSTVEPTSTPVPTPTSTVEPTPTNVPNPTPTPTVPPSQTPQPTPTSTVELTPTPSSTVEPTPTNTPVPTSTPVPTPTSTVEPTSTPVPNPTPTPTDVPQPTPTSTVGPTPTPQTPTPTPTADAANTIFVYYP